jgi:hypothetical protein
MVGHYPLNRLEESVLFNVVEYIKNKVIEALSSMKNFEKSKVMFKSKELTIMKLSKDYVDDPRTEVAFNLGKVNLTSITDEHESLTHQIDVEVHLSIIDKKIAIKNIFWVA